LCLSGQAGAADRLSHGERLSPSLRMGADASELAIKSIYLSPGRSRDWQAPATGSIVVSNGAIVKATDKGSFIRLTGIKAGATELRAGEHILQVVVVPEDRYQTYSRLDEIARDRRGFTVQTNGESVEVVGRILRWSDWEALARAQGSRKPGYVMKASLEDAVLERAKEVFPRLLNEAGLPAITLSYSPSPIAMIPAEPAELEERVARVLGPYGFRIEKSAATLGLEPLVRVNILVAEVRTKLMRSLGVQWPTAIEAQLLPAPQVPSDGRLVVGLNALEEKGLGKILASPTLLCRSGKSAEFLAGGEFPIKIANFKTQDVIWKKHGVLLKISPRADFSGRMSIAIETEVSMLDNAQTVDGVPGLLTNRIETHFDLTRPRTIALSGLIKKEWGDTTAGLPGLASIPILGSLFGSRDFRENRTELMIFVTPEVVPPEGGAAGEEGK
jgi:pilus assembly protein CpaC